MKLPTLILYLIGRIEMNFNSGKLKMQSITFSLARKLFFTEKNNAALVFYNQTDEAQHDHHQRNYSIDLIRFIAIIFVITIHSSDLYFQNYSSRYWLLGNIFKSMSRSGVDLFILISGYLLLKKDIRIPSFFFHRLQRVVIPFVFFSVIYYLHSDMGSHSVGNFVNRFVHGSVYFHLWFLYPLIGLYVCIPYIKKMLSVLNITEIKFFWLIFFLIGLYPLVHSLVFKYPDDLTRSLGLFLFGQFCGFAISGYLLKDVVVNNFLLIIVYIVATIFYAAETTWISSRLCTPFEDSTNIFIMLQSFSIFIFCKNCNFRKLKIVSEIAKYSFGIYLIHMLILPYCIWFINKFASVVHPLLVMLFIIFSTLFISYFLIKYICKVKYIKNFVN